MPRVELFTDAVVAIDGSKFKAVNNRERNYMPGKIERREREPEESIQRYLDALETADWTQPAEIQAKTERLQGKVQKMRQRMQEPRHQGATRACRIISFPDGSRRASHDHPQRQGHGHGAAKRRPRSTPRTI